MLRWRVLLTLVLAACLIVPFFPDFLVSAQGKGPEPVGLRPDAPDYAKHGPYWVGYKPVVIGEGTAQPIDAGIWYPALNPKGDKEQITYHFKFKIPPFAPGDPGEATGAALLNASADMTRGPYPLLVWTPGFGVDGPWESPQLEHYASYGFVVIGPEPIEQWDPTQSDLWKATVDRAHAIRQTLDYAEKLTASGGAMAGLIDMQRVAVGGHSSGGEAALAAAGAQINFTSFKAWCAALPKDRFDQSSCAPLLSHEADMAARAGFSPLPTGVWPSLGDSRVKAILPMAAGGEIFNANKQGLAKITLPMMILTGTFDVNYGVDEFTYDNVSSAQKTLIGMIGADHPINFLPCANVPWVYKTDFVGWVCYDPVWDKSRALDLINHFTTAFLLDVLKGDKDAHKALLPDAVKFPGIEYKTTMK